MNFAFLSKVMAHPLPLYQRLKILLYHEQKWIQPMPLLYAFTYLCTYQVKRKGLVV